MAVPTLVMDGTVFLGREEPHAFMRHGADELTRVLPNAQRRILDGQIDPSFVVTHRVPLNKGPEMYKTFRDKQDGCIKVVLYP